MIHGLYPTPVQLAKLKRPMGQLIPGGPRETMSKLKAVIDQIDPPKLVTVGDVVSNGARASGITVDVGIVDGKTLRHEYREKDTTTGQFSSTTLTARNPAGTITDEAWQTIREALRKEEQTTIFIDGEEDLLALPAVVEAPVGSLIAYGQPSEGIVVVHVTAEKKGEVVKLLESWKRN